MLVLLVMLDLLVVKDHLDLHLVVLILYLLVELLCGLDLQVIYLQDGIYVMVQVVLLI
tara:strand:- start:665 stop:838 length:174 start_codon:yes stop_codon:yes gene_type:complete